MTCPDHLLPQVEISHPLGTWWGEETRPEWLSSSSCPEKAISVSSKMCSYKSDRHYAECGIPTGIFQNSKIRLREVSHKPSCSSESPPGLAKPQTAGPYHPTFWLSQLKGTPESVFQKKCPGTSNFERGIETSGQVIFKELSHGRCIST